MRRVGSLGVRGGGVGRLGVGYAGLACKPVGGVSRAVGYGISCGRAPLGAYVSVSVAPCLGRKGRIGGGFAGDAPIGREAVISDSKDGIAAREHQREDREQARPPCHHVPRS
jgi:hypothetical protein